MTFIGENLIYTLWFKVQTQSFDSEREEVEGYNGLKRHYYLFFSAGNDVLQGGNLRTCSDHNECGYAR